ncbi:myb family transcription factor APL-like [Bidens hawaiensis]|uniref:myb family transcription factor APL-like n=1 Tax=Bidens hawaiensis TaxID=980011 RepID=UPI00404A8D15
MHEEADDDFVFNMIKNGAVGVAKRPLADDVFISARRRVINERLKEFGELESDCHTGGKKVTMSTKRNSNVQLHENGGICVKMSLEWTKELHYVFHRAALKLEKEGSCTPKNVLVEMGVPGLTRTQVASHLQKWRLELKKSNGNHSLPKASRVGSSNVMSTTVS